MASIPTCGDCRSGIPRRVESRRAAIQVPWEGTYQRMGMRRSNFEYVPVWRFGNSRARPLADLREQTD
jgi:hypothetical protein